MDQSTKKDVRISVIVGFVAGLLMLPTLRNVGIGLDLTGSIFAVLGLMVFTPAGYLVAHWFSRWFPVLKQFIKFLITGGLNAMIDLGVLNMLISFTGIAAGIGYSAFKAISFLIAVTNSYFWNKYWTFKATETGPRVGEFAKFIMVNVIGFGINVGTASLVVNVVGAPPGVSGELWANIGAVSAVFITLFFNFLGMKFIVFKK